MKLGSRKLANTFKEPFKGRGGVQSPRLVMAVSSYVHAADHDVRVQDYLDDKLQAIGDFDTLDSLLDNIKTQQVLLKDQVCFVLFVSLA